MKRFLSIAALLLPLSLFGAAGDITGVNVEDNGWVLNLTCEAGTNGGFPSFGFGTTVDHTNVISGNEKVVLTVASPGFDATGTSNNTTRTVYGTKQLRLPYALEDSYDVITNDSEGTVEIRIALSDYIYASDTATFSIASGLYTNGAITSGAASGECTVNSTTTYPSVIGNWSRPGYNKESGTTFRLGFVAFQAYGKQGKPVACVKFIATDQNSHSVTNIETQMRIDHSRGETIPTAEYFTDISQATFTHGDMITCDVEVYPWTGESTEVLSTATTRGWYDRATWHPVTITNVCDTSATYAPFIAVADATAGGSPCCTNTTPENVNAEHYFGTIAAAALALQATNNANSVPTHNNTGGSTLYVRSTLSAWMGAAATMARNACMLTIAAYPGDTVTISSQSGGDGRGAHGIRFTNITFTAGNYIGYITERMVFDHCTINTTANPFTQGVTNCWFIGCDIQKNTGQFISSGSKSIGYAFRDCFFNGYPGGIASTLMIGNYRTATNGWDFKIASDESGWLESRSEFAVWYNNKFMGLSALAGSDLFSLGRYYSLSNGAAIVQNVFEFCTNTIAAVGAYNFCTVNTLSYTNVLLWNNVFLGTKMYDFYNDSGSAAAYRNLVSLKGNVVDDWNIKSDVFPTADAARIGNWPVVYGVGFVGNCLLETTNVAAAGSFPNEFCGLNAIGDNVAAQGVAPTRVANWSGWVNPQCFDGTTTYSWPGNGDYRVTSASRLQGLVSEWLLPYDIEGNARGSFDPPGAYSSASPRKGAGFF